MKIYFCGYCLNIEFGVDVDSTHQRNLRKSTNWDAISKKKIKKILSKSIQDQSKQAGIDLNIAIDQQ